MERNVFPNQRVTPESDLYVLADLRRVWVMADMYEADLAAIRAGAPARILLPYGTTTTSIKAKVNYVQPGVDPTTRTLKLRLEADNPGMRLRPEMYVDVEFEVQGRRRLTVPAEAVLNSGERQVVFVDLGDGELRAGGGHGANLVTKCVGRHILGGQYQKAPGYDRRNRA